MVAAEQRVLLGQRKGDVVGGMAGGGDRFEGPAVARHHLAVGDLHVWPEARLLRLFARILMGRRGTADDRRAGQRLQRMRQR